MTESVTYIGAKVVNAKPMSRQEYNDFRGWTVPENENPNDDGYLVEYTDSKVQPELEGKANGYVSWSPKDVFDKAYTIKANDGQCLYAISDNGNIYVGDGATLEEAKENAERTKNTVVLNEQLEFGTALQLLQSGYRVARKGWNGADQFVYYVPENKYPASQNENSPVKGMFEGDLVPYRAYLALKTAQGDVAMWVPSISDLLAEDWVIVE